MTKQTKKLTTIIFTVLMAICTAFLIIFNIPPALTFAGESAPSETDKISDDNYGFEYGAAVMISGFKDENYRLKFTFNVINPALEDLCQYTPGEYLNGFWGTLTDARYFQTFTVKRVNSDGTTVTPLLSVMNFYAYEISDMELHLTRYTAVKKLSYYDETLTISKRDNADVVLTNAKLNKDTTKFAKKYIPEGYEITKKEWLQSTGGNTWEIIAGVNSPFAQYFVEFDYSLTKMTSKGFFGNKYTTEKGRFTSSVRSVADVLTKMNNANDLEANFRNDEESIALARSIISSNSLKNVTVNYLVEIPGTPFAKRVSALVNVPVISQGVYVDDVARALGVETFNVFNSQAYEFRYNSSTQTYDAHYLKTTWLRSITTDGHYVDYFLDINNNYRATYYQFVEDGIFSNDLYEYIFNKMLNKYPALQGMKYDEVYGYYGFITIPTTMTIDTLFVEMFDVETSMVGVIKNFSYEDVISAEAYNKLLTKYNYGWLAKVWGNSLANVTGNTKATYYIIYSEGELQTHIGEGGQTNPENPGGALWNSVQGIAGSIWRFVSGNGGFNAILIVAVIGLGVFVFYKLKFSILTPSGRTGAGRKTKPRRKTTKKRKK